MELQFNPQTHQNLHFIGIKGIGTSGLAVIAKNLGYNVTGSDHDQIVSWLDQHAQDSTIILVKGSRGMQMEKIVTSII